MRRPRVLLVSTLVVAAAACTHSGTALSAERHARPPAASTAVLAVKVCFLNELALDYYGGGAGAGNDFGTIRIRDLAAAPCLLGGPIVVTGVDARGHPVTRAIAYPVTPGLVLTGDARRVPVGQVAPPGEQVGDLVMGASYRDDPASPDGICHTHRVVPSVWKVAAAGGMKNVRNASYDPNREFASLVTCYGQIDNPERVRLDD